MKIPSRLLLIGFWLGCAARAALDQNGSAPNAGHVVTEHILSQALRDNALGIDPQRSISVYLPSGYEHSTQSYPVIYYIHSLNWSNERMFSAGMAAQGILDRAIARGVIRPFILVAANYTTPSIGTFFGNAPTSGRWLDYTLGEVVPYIDSHFRTIPRRDARAVAGDFMGGYAALKLAMFYPDTFGTVYALHPVGTGTGVVPAYTRVDWKKIHAAKSFADLQGDPFAPGYVTMAQAYLPNAQRPPFFCDFMVEWDHGELKVNQKNTQALFSRFLLDALLDQHAEGFRRVHIAFDWARYDPNPDHVYANQVFSRKLDQLGIEHVGEEYNGDPWSKNWTDDGRVYCRMLPFFERTLAFTP